jgi:hypothetical protein
MRVEAVEIYSDATNAAILRHPGRRFPGLLIQGDTLHNLCIAIDRICTGAQSNADDDALQEIDDLREQMWGYLSHYKSVLQAHGLSLPFSEIQAP